jgi:tRNA A-37 threonylcarbamoyl transferase component Bud32
MKICGACSTTYPDQVGFCPKDGSPLAELHEWIPGASVRGKYRILSTVGRGGMGSVYKALHLGFHELRALKVLNRDLAADARFVKRFKQEASITRKLQHPNVVRVEDIDETEDGQPFIVMEFIEGRNLREMIEKHGAMRVAAACSVVKQIASALLVAHSLGVVHRDLKPENIVLVASKGAATAAEPVVKVLDFGIAKLKEVRAEGNPNDSTLTQPGFLLGTPEYMSPEQLMGKRGDDLDGRSDIYSLGILMYRMLTGELPFHASTTMEMLLAHLREAPRPIRSIRPDLQIPEPIADLVMQCLEKSREARPQTAQALIQALERAEALSKNAAFTQRVSPGEALSANGPAVQAGRATVVLPEAALVIEDQAAVVQQHQAAHDLARPGATVMAPRTDIDEVLPAASAVAKPAVAKPAVAKEDQPHILSGAGSAPQDRVTAGSPEPEAAPMQVQEAALAHAQDLARPEAGAVVPRNEIDERLSPGTDAAENEQPPHLGSFAQAGSSLITPEQRNRRWSRGGGWAIALSAIVLLGATALVISNHKQAIPDPGVTIPVVQPQPSASPLRQSPMPSQAERAVERQPSEVSEKRKTAGTPSATIVSDQAHTPELKKHVRAAETEGDKFRELGEYDQAIHAYEEGLKLDPADGALHAKIALSKRAKAAEQELNH